MFHLVKGKALFMHIFVQHIFMMPLLRPSTKLEARHLVVNEANITPGLTKMKVYPRGI